MVTVGRKLIVKQNEDFENRVHFHLTWVMQRSFKPLYTGIMASLYWIQSLSYKNISVIRWQQTADIFDNNELWNGKHRTLYNIISTHGLFFRWGLEKLLYMAKFNFVRGFDVYKERTLSLVTWGYQEVVGYLRSALHEAERLSASNDTIRAALYVSCMKEIHRIQVTYGYRLVDHIEPKTKWWPIGK